MITIKYKDNADWTTVEGKIISWKRYAETRKEGRILPAFLAPVVITDTWNDRVYEVQHILYEPYELEFWIKESELHSITRMMSCSDLIISDDTGIEHIVSNDEAEIINIDEPERVADTSNFSVRIVYKTNKTVIDKLKLPSGYTGSAETSVYLSYNEHGTNIEIRDFKSHLPVIINPLSPELVTYSNDDGINKRAKTITKTGNLVCLYLSDADANYFVDLSSRAQYRSLNGQQIVDAETPTVTRIGDDLTKVEWNAITQVKVSYPEFYNL